MSNINDSYFDGYYKDIWRSIIPSELTQKEVDFMMQYFELKSGNKVLDIMCGYGRHSLALARKGIKVEAVDNLEAYITEINNVAKAEQLPVVARKASVIGYKPSEISDLAICMGNSFCFFEEKEVLQLLQTISAHLKPSGWLLINSWAIAEIAFQNFREKSWSEINGLKFITEGKYHLQPSRIEYEHLILSADGKTEVKKAIDYIYSIAEVDKLLSNAGLEMKEVFSIPGRKKFSLGEPRAYFVAQKN